MYKMQNILMNILTYNLCLKPITFELLKEYLNKKNSTVFAIDFNINKKIYDNYLKKAIFCDQRYSKKALDHDGTKIAFYLNQKIISDFYKVETIIYRIMSRYESNDYSFNFKNRKNHFFDLLKYSFGLIKKYKIDKIIFFDYPHHMESYTLYQVAKYLNIKIIIISYLYLGEYRLVVDYNLKNRFHEYCNDKKIYKFEDKNLRYFNEISDKKKHLKPFYIAENRSVFYLFYFFLKDFYRSFLNGFFSESNNFIKSNLNKKFQNIKFPSELYSSLLMFFNRIKILKLQKIYLKLCYINPNLENKYVLFCPNLQPEASTLPMAGIYSDYEIILDTMLESLPEDWTIYYKEHPLVFNLLKESYLSRDKYYYLNLINKKVKFIDYRLDTFELVDKANIVITPTGSIGIETMIRGKKIGYFGNPWWKYFKNAHYIKDSLDFKNLINQSDDKQQINNNFFIKDYIKTFEQSFPWIGFSFDNYYDLLNEIKKNNFNISLFNKLQKYLIDKIDNLD